MNNLSKTDENRIRMYRLLGKLYLIEVDEKTLVAFKGMQFPEITGKSSAELDLKEGYELIKKYFAENTLSDEATIEELAVDYAKTFLSAGDQSGQSAFPFESVYKNMAHQIYGESTAEEEKLYAAKGLKLREDMFKVTEDHLGAELEFMAKLIAEAPVDEQKAYVKNHLLNWVSSFTADVVKYAATDFYKGWAKVTNGMLGLERENYGL